MSKRQSSTKSGLASMVVNPRAMMKRADNTTASLVRRFTTLGTLATATGLTLGSAGITTALEWTNISARYTEARVLGIRVFWSPIAAAASGILLPIATDRSGALANPVSVNAAWGLAGARLICCTATAKTLPVYEAWATDLEDFNFQPVGSITSQYAVQTYNGTGSALAYYVEYIVEFRGNR